MTSRDLHALNEEIAGLLTTAAQIELDHAEATRIAAQAHQAELEHLVESALRLAAVHETQQTRNADVHAAELANLNRALENRDLIGQAKGFLVAAMRCSSDHAFAVMVKQSQHENRKVVEIAAEVVERAHRRAFDRKVIDN